MRVGLRCSSWSKKDGCFNDANRLSLCVVPHTYSVDTLNTHVSKTRIMFVVANSVEILLFPEMGSRQKQYVYF